MLNVLLLIFGCIPKNSNIKSQTAVYNKTHHYAVDKIENEVCLIQVSDDKFLSINSEICNTFKEGDVLLIMRPEN